MRVCMFVHIQAETIGFHHLNVDKEVELVN